MLFKMYNNNVYKSYMLHQEIKTKRYIIARQKKDFNNIKNIFREKVSTFDFIHISSVLNSKLRRAKNAHFKKLQSLGFNNKLSQNPKNAVHLPYSLSYAEKTVFPKGLNYALPLTKFDYRDYLTHFFVILHPYNCVIIS